MKSGENEGKMGKRGEMLGNTAKSGKNKSNSGKNEETEGKKGENGGQGERGKWGQNHQNPLKLIANQHSESLPYRKPLQFSNVLERNAITRAQGGCLCHVENIRMICDRHGDEEGIMQNGAEMEDSKYAGRADRDRPWKFPLLKTLNSLNLTKNTPI